VKIAVLVRLRALALAQTERLRRLALATGFGSSGRLMILRRWWILAAGPSWCMKSFPTIWSIILSEYSIAFGKKFPVTRRRSRRWNHYARAWKV